MQPETVTPEHISRSVRVGLPLNGLTDAIACAAYYRYPNHTAFLQDVLMTGARFTDLFPTSHTVRIIKPSQKSRGLGLMTDLSETDAEMFETMLPLTRLQMAAVKRYARKNNQMTDYAADRLMHIGWFITGTYVAGKHLTLKSGAEVTDYVIPWRMLALSRLRRLKRLFSVRHRH